MSNLTPVAQEVEETAATLGLTPIRLPVKCCRLLATFESHLLDGSMTGDCGGAAGGGTKVLGRLTVTTSPS